MRPRLEPVLQAQESGGRRKRRDWSASEIVRLRELAGKFSDGEIGRKLDRPTGSIWAKRHELGIAARPGPGVPLVEIPHGERRGYDAGCRGDDCPSTPSCREAARAGWRAAAARKAENEAVAS